MQCLMRTRSETLSPSRNNVASPAYSLCADFQKGHHISHDDLLRLRQTRAVAILKHACIPQRAPSSQVQCLRLCSVASARFHAQGAMQTSSASCGASRRAIRRN